MCVYSMVINDWQKGPNKILGWPQYDPNNLPLTDWVPKMPTQITPDIAQQMVEVLKRLDALDKKLGNVDCLIEQAVKDKIVEALQKRADDGVGPT